MEVPELINWISKNLGWPSIYFHEGKINAYFYDHKGRGPYELKREYPKDSNPDFQVFLEELKFMFEDIKKKDEEKEAKKKK